jgi:predicted transcriptional regulator
MLEERLTVAQPKPEDRTQLDHVLKLVDQLSPEHQEQLVEEVKLQWLRREVQRGIEQADRGELIDGGEVFAALKERYKGKDE